MEPRVERIERRPDWSETLLYHPLSVESGDIPDAISGLTMTSSGACVAVIADSSIGKNLRLVPDGGTLVLRRANRVHSISEGRPGAFSNELKDLTRAQGLQEPTSVLGVHAAGENRVCLALPYGVAFYHITNRGNRLVPEGQVVLNETAVTAVTTVDKRAYVGLADGSVSVTDGQRRAHIGSKENEKTHTPVRGIVVQSNPQTDVMYVFGKDGRVRTGQFDRETGASDISPETHVLADRFSPKFVAGFDNSHYAAAVDSKGSIAKIDLDTMETVGKFNVPAPLVNSDGPTVTALHLHDNLIFVGTNKGLVRVYRTDADNHSVEVFRNALVSHEKGSDDSPNIHARITQISSLDNGLFVATAAGTIHRFQLPQAA